MKYHTRYGNIFSTGQSCVAEKNDTWSAVISLGIVDF